MTSPPDEGERTDYLDTRVSTRVNAAMRHPAQWVLSHATRRRGAPAAVFVAAAAARLRARNGEAAAASVCLGQLGPNGWAISDGAWAE